MSVIRRLLIDASGDFGWQDVDRLQYKAQGSAPFKDITRQVLFSQADHACELRYFEIAPGGYSTLEQHQHTHAVLILRGRGTVRIGTDVQPIAEHDLVTVDPLTWHQFHAASESALFDGGLRSIGPQPATALSRHGYDIGFAGGGGSGGNGMNSS